jgi:hypothetical protein
VFQVSSKLQNNIESSLWQSVYREQLLKVDQSKDINIIKSYSLMAAKFADEAIFEFRARAGHHSQVLDVVHGSSDKDFENKHGMSLNSCQCAIDDN